MRVKRRPYPREREVLRVLRIYLIPRPTLRPLCKRIPHKARCLSQSFSLCANMTRSCCLQVSSCLQSRRVPGKFLTSVPMKLPKLWHISWSTILCMYSKLIRIFYRHSQEAGDNAALAIGIAKNITLVYIDTRGIGRRAIIITGKELGKTLLNNNRRPSRVGKALM